MPSKPTDAVHQQEPQGRAKRALVTGAGGFIGRHLCKELVSLGWDIVRADVREFCFQPAQEADDADELPKLHKIDLREQEPCFELAKGCDVIFHLAADMGGMGFIGVQENEAAIMESNQRLTSAVATAARATKAVVIYTSSACVYPDHLQEEEECRELREDDAGALPSDVYGSEKLLGERLLAATLPPDQVRIARLHNVFGPRCTWRGGREKAPAAILRKALAIALGTAGLSSRSGFTGDRRRSGEAGDPAARTLELWGDGKQTRTYLFVDDCVRALVSLATVQPSAGGNGPPEPVIVNVGSSRVISVDDLAHLALDVAGVGATARIQHDTSGPQGVRGRSCDFSRAKALLRWEPTTSLEDGLRTTAAWICGEMQALLSAAADEGAKRALLAHWRRSDLALPSTHSLLTDSASFGILLPITTRGHVNSDGWAEPFWDSLNAMAAQLGASVHGDPLRPRLQVLVGLDDDDPALGVDCRAARSRLVSMIERLVCWQGGTKESSRVTLVSLSGYPAGAICEYWDALARKAHALGCTHLVLLGDDVHVKTRAWMTRIADAFEDMARRTGLPHGFGCVAFTDESFAGFPTFPVVTATHMEMMGGRLLPPDTFVNQDADPFLFQLYRRWDAAVMLPDARLVNTVGGLGNARYNKTTAAWTGIVLDNTVKQAAAWLEQQGPAIAHASRKHRRIVMDIAIPTYRCDLDLLHPMLQLTAPEDVSLGYIVVVDRPSTDPIAEECLTSLHGRYARDWRYRIRCQDANTGAPSARNRALGESAADYVLFLDDDVEPQDDIVHAYAAAIRNNPTANGFAGPTFFPRIETPHQLGARLAGVTFFWDFPATATKVSWAVTANVLLRRLHNVYFNTVFPTAGGGEDIDYCLKVTGDEQLLAVPEAKATHPWWNNGAPALSRFWGWARGDGALNQLYPHLTYRLPPNSAEALVLLAAGFLALHAAAAVVAPTVAGSELHDGVVMTAVASTLLALSNACGLRACVIAAGSILGGELVAEGARHLLLDRHFHSIGEGLLFRAAAVPHALAVRVASEAGRTFGHLVRGRVDLLLSRFDWFVGHNPNSYYDELWSSLLRIGCWIGVAGLLFAVWP